MLIIKIFKKSTGSGKSIEPYSFMSINTTLPADNPLRFRKIFSDSPL